MSQDSNSIITAFVREFDNEAPSAATLGAYFTDHAVYHNIPMAPVTGKAAIEAVLGGMASGGMRSMGWEVKHQVANGNVVMNERVDRFKVGEKTIAIPVTGVFVLEGGRIAEWRDYFDLAMFQDQMK